MENELSPRGLIKLLGKYAAKDISFKRVGYGTQVVFNVVTSEDSVSAMDIPWEGIQRVLDTMSSD